MEIFYSPKFLKTYKKIPSRIKMLAEKKEKIFGEVEKDPELKPIYEAGFKKFFRFLLKGE